ncbi:hypothetical protein [Fusobacterium sp. PH5-44]|uniref:hypothetical protein n=1 Tax=unclassified Fusobacterium TaxID=2648384 RepID=UPI003D1BD922
MKKLILIIVLLASSLLFGTQNNKEIKVYENMKITEDNKEYKDYVRKLLNPNVKRINAIKNWSDTKQTYKNELYSDEAEIIYYYSEKGLEKIKASLIAEVGHSTIEYYFLDNKLSMIKEEEAIFIIPITEDGYDPNKTKKTKRSYYFKENEFFRYQDSRNKRPSNSEKIENAEKMLDIFKEIINDI